MRNDLIDRLTSGQTPSGVLLVTGILVLVIAWKFVKGMVKFVLFLVALVLLGAAALWYMKHR